MKNNIHHRADACTSKKHVKQLFEQLGKSINNQQRQALIDIYTALDNAAQLRQQLNQVNAMLSNCLDSMDEEQRSYVEQLNKANQAATPQRYDRSSHHNMISHRSSF